MQELTPTEPMQDIDSDAAAILKSGGALQKIQTAYTTAIAVQKPRNLDVCVKKVMQECDYAGAEFFYHWKVQGKTVEGPSIGMAMCLVRNWTNCAMELQDVRDLDDGRQEFIAAFVDLETGVTLPRAYRFMAREAPARFNEKVDERERWADMQFQIGQSKALRNAALAGIPQWLVKRAMRRATKAELDGINATGVADARAAALDWLRRRGITDDQIKAFLDVNALEDIGGEDIAKLNAAAHAIHNGEVTADALFLRDKREESPDQKKAASALAKKFEEEQKKGKAKPKAAQSGPDPLTDLRAAVAAEWHTGDVPNALANELTKAYPGLKDIATMPEADLTAVAKKLGVGQ